MTALRQMTAEQLAELVDDQRSLYAELKARGLKLDITRGKPASSQLDLSNALLTQQTPSRAADGTDVRNYGGATGLPELRAMFSELLRVPLDNLIAEGNSSLSLMHDVLSYAMLHGMTGVNQPWAGQQIKFICPVPGYDRHFAITAHLGVEMIPVELGPTGPDLDQVRALAADPQVKGMWVVPTYSNPSGITYDEATVRGLLEMDAAPDFRIWWDNAYALHHLTSDEQEPFDVITMAARAGHADRVFTFASTSKISFAGSGVAFLGASSADLAWYLRHASKRTIGPDKINQLRHAKFFGDAAGVRNLMRQHRDQLTPKFQIVDDTLNRRLADYDVARWTTPRGGYFVTLDVMDGTASRVVQLAKDAGIALTPAGSSHPLGRDPHDRTIRLAPSFPSRGELCEAMDGVATCVLLAAAEAMEKQARRD